MNSWPISLVLAQILTPTFAQAAKPSPTNQSPTVSLTAPADGAVYPDGAEIELTAQAADADGRIRHVRFHQGDQRLHSVAHPPYSHTWKKPPPGRYILTAVATDNQGAETTSAPITISVGAPANQSPTVSLTAPADGAVYRVNPGATLDLGLTAAAADPDGGSVQVAFLDGPTLLGTASAAPYVLPWNNVAPGSHALTARATDTQGASTTSAPITITVAEAPATTLYFIEADHLGTPRLIADATGKPVWRWDNREPFGDSPPDEDPDGDGKRFEFNLRFAGQYFDQETGLHYNYFRDYDSSIGRYLTPDPIGLEGGINLYGYVSNDPVNFVDPFGLDATDWNNTSGGRSRLNGPSNGNWGGKCWSGGQYSCGGNRPGNAPPTDSGDQCYQRHDNCDVACGSNFQCIAACNGSLVDELGHLPNDPRQWESPPRPGTEGDSRRYRDWAIDYFRR